MTNSRPISFRLSGLAIWKSSIEQTPALWRLSSSSRSFQGAAGMLTWPSGMLDTCATGAMSGGFLRFSMK